MPARFSTGFAQSDVDNFVTNFQYSVIEIYGTPSSTQPSDADDTEVTAGGTLLGVITLTGLAATTPMTVTNGLQWERTALIAGILAGQVWKGTGAVTGTAVWFRCYDLNFTKGASATAKRWDGTCATSGGQLNLNSLSIVTGGEILVSSASYTVPKKA